MIDSGFSPSDASALGKGLLYGDDSAFSSGFREVILSAGVTHLVAASGANLAYVLWLPQKIWGSKNRLLSQVISCVVIWLYWHLAEQSGSLWRAIGMWLLAFIATNLGRSSGNGWNLLTWLVICGFWFRERMLTHSFFLSALAIVGLLFSQILKSGENNIAVIMHSKKGICYWKNRLQNIWFEGSIIFVTVEVYLWLFFQSFQPIGIYTTIVLQPFLPLYLSLSGFLEASPFLLKILPEGFSSWLLLLIQITIRGQQTLFACLIFLLRTMSQLSNKPVWAGSVQWGFFVAFIIVIRRGWWLWLRHQQFEKWRAIIDFTN